MNKRCKIILYTLLAVASHIAMAAEQPLKLASDPRIEVVAYSPYNVVPVIGTTFTATQITFGQNEYIESVQNGDIGAWTASINKNLPNMMFIKPTVYNSKTNMTVVTNEHTYYFELISNPKNHATQAKATYAIHFVYPEQKQAKVEAQIRFAEQQKHAEVSAFKNPSAYNWDYSFHGDRRILPIHVFDDGQFTYMQLQPHQPVPAVFAVLTPNGQESVVNYRIDGRYLVVQRTAPEFTLRVGKHQVATIFNNKMIAKFN